MYPLLLALLACAPDSLDTPPAAAEVRPFCTWTDDVLCTGANEPQPLDGELLMLIVCLDYDSGLTTCAGNGWRIFDDGTWVPSTCGEGFYYRACISD